MKEESNITVIPAESGYTTVYINEEDQCVEIGLPVIAWSIETISSDYDLRHFVTPITLSDYHSNNALAGTLSPKGNIVTIYGECFKDIPTFEKYRFKRIFK